MKYNIVVGQQFGRWVVVGHITQDEKKRYIVECRCECGFHFFPRCSELVNGRSKGCKICQRKDRQEGFHKFIDNQKKQNDLTGKVFGEWTVLRRDSEKTSCWECRCSCGVEKSIYISVLTSGRSQRCRSCHYKRGYSKDMTGYRCGMLTVVRPGSYRKGARGAKAFHWVCRCDCGNEVEVRLDNLCDTSRKNKTCGCGRSGKNSSIWKGCGDLSGEKWNQIIKAARSRDLKVTVTIEEVWELYQRQDGKCALTGWDLIIYKRGGSASRATTASLDRIDSSKGYTLDNIQWVHKWANIAKMALPQEDFINMCKAIAKYRG